MSRAAISKSVDCALRSFVADNKQGMNLNCDAKPLSSKNWSLIAQDADKESSVPLIRIIGCLDVAWLLPKSKEALMRWDTRGGMAYGALRVTDMSQDSSPTVLAVTLVQPILEFVYSSWKAASCSSPLLPSPSGILYYMSRRQEILVPLRARSGAMYSFKLLSRKNYPLPKAVHLRL